MDFIGNEFSLKIEPAIEWTHNLSTQETVTVKMLRYHSLAYLHQFYAKVEIRQMYSLVAVQMENQLSRKYWHNLHQCMCWTEHVFCSLVLHS